MPGMNQPLANPMVVLREEFDDWAVLFNPDTADAFGVNPVGVAVWKLMDGTRSPEQIISEIGSQFSDVPEAASGDIVLFIDELKKRGFAGDGTESPT